MKYHSLQYQSYAQAVEARQKLGDLGLPLTDLAIRDTPYTVNFYSDENLNMATQTLILDQTRPSLSHFNEEPPFFSDEAIRDYAAIMTIVNSGATLSASQLSELQALERRAVEQDLKFEFSKEGGGWTLVPLKARGFNEELSEDELGENDEFDQGHADEDAERSNN